MSDSILTDLQADLAARLAADEYFVDITVLTERTGDILSGINDALGTITTKNSKLGVCVILMQPVASVDMPNVPNALMDIKLTARVLEDVVMNTSASGTGKAALSIARRIARVLHHYAPYGLAQALICDKPTIVPVTDPIAPMAYEVHFTTQEAEVDQFIKVSTPTISPGVGTPPQTVTLACATSGATIFYTLDKSYPSAGNVNAVLYTAPIAINTATTLRAAAFKSGYLPSDVNRADYA